MYNVDGVMESRVSVKSKVHLSTVKSELLRCDALAECYSRVKDAGCDVLPDYANGAMLLVPLPEEQIHEAGLELKDHNIVMLARDHDRVKKALIDPFVKQRNGRRETLWIKPRKG